VNLSDCLVVGLGAAIMAGALVMRLSGIITSEVENKMILMGHQISSCHAPVVRSFKGNSKVI
jgi:hypothetical protein